MSSIGVQCPLMGLRLFSDTAEGAREHKGLMAKIRCLGSLKVVVHSQYRLWRAAFKICQDCKCSKWWTNRNSAADRIAESMSQKEIDWVE